MALHLVQLTNGAQRRVARVDGDGLMCLSNVSSVYDLARDCIHAQQSLAGYAEALDVDATLRYEPIYSGQSEWRLLPPVDVPGNPSRCIVSGTGLTHMGSAASRQAMHAMQAEAMTDSMRMFQWGLQEGNPGKGKVGVAPEWFYKGTGTMVRAHLQPLDVPFYAEDGGEEAEVAAIYFIDDEGTPQRLGFTAGNEFSDHVFEKKNYLNLAGSKLRSCSLGPELVVTDNFTRVPGKVSIEREGKVLWSAAIETGEEAMCHSLQNLEHHHFKFENHRIPGDLHVHFLGAAALSFSNNVSLVDGDWMQVVFEGFGRPLRNPLRVATPQRDRLITVHSLA